MRYVTFVQLYGVNTMDMLVEIKIGNNLYQTKPGVIKGSDLHKLANISPPQQLVVSRSGKMDIPIAPDDYVIIEGDEKFAVGDGIPPLEDNPCLRAGINFILNGEKFKGNNALYKAKLTGAEIKALDTSGQSSDGLFAELNGYADEPVQDNWRIVVQDKDSFITVPCGNVGEQSSNTIQSFDVQLSELKGLHSQIEVIQDGGFKLVKIKNLPLPYGWDRDSTDLMIQVPASYPPSALDMFWLFPHIKLLNGAWPDCGNQFQQHAGINWQRFSWHYTDKQWDPVRNTLSSHFRFCMARLAQLQ